ncbi:hypothetical protein NEIMUCOT_04888 [Neisseria mucosa ATCC 25996]|uniref:Uncharacterized protein n=1 Tax=Neisseria mucosa (strain ATCC 25996 / DSM 4631 / NCTC 10774 / M26) TaxID=546266 RepID=D2ZW95_NEIM2|nr:hypothetical protein NEIMUCOT_04888 [Neisseria mucosa ATCC 25996]
MQYRSGLISGSSSRGRLKKLNCTPKVGHTLSNSQGAVFL